MTETPTVAVIAPGNMGAAVAKRLTEHKVTVLTVLSGRSKASEKRAQDAGMQAVDERKLAEADFVLSIVPPGEALALAKRLAKVLTESNTKPIYVECNAVSPQTMNQIAEVIAATGCPFVGAAIIGPPPKPGATNTKFYAAGPAAADFAKLNDYGLTLRLLDGPVSAASALKMSYAGITKGTQAIGAAMMLAATRAGSADALFAELSSSQKEMFAWFKRGLALMPPKAYRWIAEMHEIAGFVGDDPAARDLYEGAAHFYERIAEDFDGGKKDVAALTEFLGKAPSGN